MLEPTAPAPSPDPTHRSATRLLCAVHELHGIGYQRVRFSSGMAPSGMYRRCSITHAGNMSDDRLQIHNHASRKEFASYSTASQDRYFDWPDAPSRTARELAALFADRFPRIVQMGEGSDWAYAGWLTEVIGRAERGGPASLPIFFADYPLNLDPISLPPPVRTRSRWQRMWGAMRRAR